MAYVNYKNSPSEETPLTGGATGNLNVMQENGTSHGTDTKLGYSQSFLNDHLVNVSNEVDEDYRVNLLKGKNLINCNAFTSYSTTGVNVTTSKTDGLLDYINVTKSSSTSGNIFISICNFTFSKETGTYSLSGCPSGGGESTYQLYFKDDTTTQDVYPRNDGTPASVSLTKGHNYTLYLRLNASSTFTDKKFYPMLLPTTETDISYEPYITPSIYVDNEEIYSKMKVYTDTYATYFKFDKMVCCVVNRQSQTTDGTIATIPSEFACANDMRNVINYYNGSSYVSGILWSQNVGLYIRDMYGNVPSNASFIRGMLIWEAKN